MSFYLFIVSIILLRIAELLLSNRNEKWLIANGAIEYGTRHYPYIVALHFCFLVSLITEYSLQGTHQYSVSLIELYYVLIAFKVWVILSLGTYWNTKILRIHGMPLITKGAYRFVKHPNYIIVFAEILMIPLAFELYYTAVIFTVLNAVVIYIRIKEENRALVL